MARSIAALRKELESRTQELSKLEAQRGKLARQLEGLDRRIAAVRGTAPAPRAPKKARRKKAAKKAPGPAAGKPLAQYIREALTGSREGMRVKEIVAAVKKAGYRSSAKDFYGVVAAALHDKRFQRLSRGVYRLKGAGKRAAKAPKAAKRAAKTAKRRKRPNTAPAKGKSLKALLAKALSGEKAMSVGGAMKAVLHAGYQTTSGNFRQIVNQTLARSNEFKKVARGKYALKG